MAPSLTGAQGRRLVWSTVAAHTRPVDRLPPPIAAHVRLKAVVKALEQVLKATEDIVRDEAEKHGKTFSAFGAEIQIKEGALTPDYTHDQVWSDLQASMKAREELLKIAFRNAGKATVYDESTGEAVPVCPAKGTKPSIAVTFKTT